MKLRFTKGCIAGTAYCVILPNGDLQPCPYFPVKAGNIREGGFASLWRTSPLMLDLRQSGLHAQAPKGCSQRLVICVIQGCGHPHIL